MKATIVILLLFLSSSVKAQDSVRYYRDKVIQYQQKIDYYNNMVYNTGNEDSIRVYMILHNKYILKRNRFLYYNGKNVFSEFPKYPLSKRDSSIF